MTSKNQLSDLSDAQLLRRSKELDAREAYIAEREKIATDLELEIVEYNRQIELKRSTIAERDKLLTSQNEQLHQLDKDYAKQAKKHETSKATMQEVLNNLTSRIEEATQLLQSVNETIKQRESYQKQQEYLIGEQSEKGNLQLRGIEYEITESKQVIKDLKSSIRALYNDKQLLEQDLNNVRSNFAPEITQHEIALDAIYLEITKANDNLVIIQQQSSDAYKNLNIYITEKQIVTTEIDSKLAILDVKEREIMVKRDALREELKELESRRHYMASSKSLYDVN